MASEGSDDAAHPNLNLTPEERQVYGQIFRQADTESVGIVVGEVAVKFFEKTRLDSRLLGEIWQIADKENRGFLTPAGFGIALRLIGHAQAGREPSPSLAFQPGPIPRFDDIAPLVPSATGATTIGGSLAAAPQLVPQGTGAGGARVPPLAIDKAAQYAKLYQDQARGAAILPGDRAKRIFERSGLANDVLGRIWQLADTEQRGALVQTEFIIAMHLLTSTKLGVLRTLPAVLPAALYEAATRGAAAAASGNVPPVGPGPGSPVPRQQSPLGAGGLPPPPTIQRQMTGQRLGPQFTGASIGRPAPPAAITPNTTGGGVGGGSDWLITPVEKARMEPVFESLDKTKKGFITGEEAVPFLMRSGLSEDALAQIWDLADVNSEGRLNSDTFAVALYLIQQQRQRTDGSSAIPTKLPLNLIPPSMRSQVSAGSPLGVQQQQKLQAVPPPPPPPQPKSALDDLFGLDSGPSSPPTVPALAPVTVGAPLTDPFASSSSPIPPSSPVRASPSVAPSFKPFVPSSSFGRSLTAQATGDSNSSALSGSYAKPAVAGAAVGGLTAAALSSISSSSVSAQNDLLSSENDDASRNLSNDTAELANLSNQVSSLSKHMQDVQTHRATLQTELNQTSTQKKNFEQRLAQLRTLYEKEARDVRTLEEQLKTSQTETKKLQTEVAALTASYHDLQNQHQQVSAALQADLQENTSLKQRIVATTAEVNQLKPQIEKLKSEARQQKGIVAINRKQLSLGESEREKLKTEAADLTRENEELAREVQSSGSAVAAATAAGTAGAAHVSAVTSSPSSNASPSVASSTGKNPFFRRTGSNDIMGVFTPQATGGSSSSSRALGDKSFDDVFGPPPLTTTATTSNTGAVAAGAAAAGVAAVAAVAAGAALATSSSTASLPTAFQPQTTGASSGSGSSVYTAPTSATATPAISRQPTFAPEPASYQVESPFAAHGGAPVAATTDGASTATPAESTPAASSASPVPAHAVVETEGTSDLTKSRSNGDESTASSSAFPAVPAGAAAAAGVAGAAGIAAAATNALSSNDDPQEKKSVWTPSHAANDSINDPFSAMDQDQDKAKEDFESAFASFKAAKAASTSPAGGDSNAFAFAVKDDPAKDNDAVKTDASKSIAAFNSEFPPISELEHDESDSESGGFDDDFAPASPKTSHVQAAEAATAVAGTATATTTATSNGEDASMKPPSPELTKAVSPSPAADVFSTPAAVSNMDDIFSAPASSAPAAAPAPAAATTAAAAAKVSASDFDELDDEFEGLEDAREGSADDDFANISRSGTDVFTSAFDSSPAPSQQNKLDTSFGVDSSFDFGSFGGSATTATQNGGANNKNGTAAPAADANDWFSFASTGEETTPSTAAAAAAAATTATVDPAVRPAPPGRVLSDDSEHDDPTLKKLTSMGYARNVALSALEKYDYNVDRAANYLASQS